MGRGGTVLRAPHRHDPFSPQSTGRPCPEPDFSGGPGCACPWAGVSKETWAALCSAEPPPQPGPGRREPRPPGKCAPRAGEGASRPRSCSRAVRGSGSGLTLGSAPPGQVCSPQLGAQDAAWRGDQLSSQLYRNKQVKAPHPRTFSVGLWHISLLLARMWETVECHFT